MGGGPTAKQRVLNTIHTHSHTYTHPTPPHMLTGAYRHYVSLRFPSWVSGRPQHLRPHKGTVLMHVYIFTLSFPRYPLVTHQLLSLDLTSMFASSLGKCRISFIHPLVPR